MPDDDATLPPRPTEPSPAPETTQQHVSAILDNLKIPRSPDVRPAPRPPEEDQARGLSSMIERRQLRLANAWHTVPERFRWADFDDPRLGQRVKQARFPGGVIEDPVKLLRFEIESPPSLLLMGASGSGKTSLAAACVRHIVKGAYAAIERGGPIYRMGCGVRFVTAYDLAKAQIYSRLGRRPELVTQAISASLLVIDELGMDTEVFRESATSVREVIHERHSRHGATIITTYLSKTALKRHYGAGIANRVASFKIIRLGDPK